MLLQLLSGCAAITVRPLILMAVSGFLALARPRRNVRRVSRPDPRSLQSHRRPHVHSLDDWERRSKCASTEAKSGFLASCRRAEPEDYKRWLAICDPVIDAKCRSYKLDTRSTHTDRCWGYPQWVVAERDIRVTPLYGAMAVSIIAMPGVIVEGDLGHSKVFLMDGGRMNCNGAATRYTNT